MTPAWRARVRPSTRAHDAVAVLDVGASKLACLVARADDAASVAPMALAHGPATGLRDGLVVDPCAAAQAIRAVVRDAERRAAVRINRLTVGFSGRGVELLRVRGQRDLGDRPIGDGDVRRALAQAALGRVGAGRVVLQAIPTYWRVDGEPPVEDPRGLSGARLEVEAALLTAPAGAVRALNVALERAGLELRSVAAAPYASAIACVLEEEAARGAAVIDLGAGATTAAVFTESAVRHVIAIPVGGARITADLAHGLGVAWDRAEAIKRRRGDVSAAALSDHTRAPLTPETQDSVAGYAAPAELARYLRPRVEELFELLRTALTQSPDYLAGGRVVLTGGGAQLSGVAEVARRVLGRKLRLAAGDAALSPKAFDGAFDGAFEAGVARDPAFATVIGLARHALATPLDALAGPPQAVAGRERARAAWRRPTSLWRAAGITQTAQWLRENF